MSNEDPRLSRGDLFYLFLDLHRKFNNQLVLLNFNDDRQPGIKAYLLQPAPLDGQLRSGVAEPAVRRVTYGVKPLSGLLVFV